MTGNENFLSRWSRLKREPEAEPAEPEDTAAQPESEPAATETASAEDSAVAGVADDDAGEDVAADAPHPAEAIDIDSLTRDSDFTVFVKKGVPVALQRKALRKLWTLDPVLANLDGLNDYENIIEEFGITDLKPGGSGWKVGRGFMTDEDFKLVNERGGYGSREGEAEAEEDEELLAAAGDEDAEEADATPGGDDAEDIAPDSPDDEFDVGGGDDRA